MSTNDVPGANRANGDVLAMGSWAESSNNDGSYIFVESVENGRVIYCVFDTKTYAPRVIEFRDAMDEDSFKQTFSYDPKQPRGVRWTWHDKTPPTAMWDLVIKAGARPGARFASASDIIEDADEVADTIERTTTETAAQRVARDLGLRGGAVSNQTRSNAQGSTRLRRALGQIRDGIQAAIDELRP